MTVIEQTQEKKICKQPAEVEPMEVGARMEVALLEQALRDGPGSFFIT